MVQKYEILTDSVSSELIFFNFLCFFLAVQKIVLNFAASKTEKLCYKTYFLNIYLCSSVINNERAN